MKEIALTQLRKQFENITEQTKILTKGLTEPQFNWRPGPAQWSIEECLSHLVIAGTQQLKLIEAAIKDARAKGLTSAGPFRYGVIERWILRQLEPDSTRKFSAPRRMQPVHGQPLTAVLPTFTHLQSQFIRAAEQSEDLDLARIKVPSPVSRLLKYSLGITLAVVAAHERRHLEQARRVREHQQFPSLA